MTAEEFSNEFDTLINSYGDGTTTNLTFDEYEKSVFLTKAQEEIVISLYNGKNTAGESFENTEEIRRYLSNLIMEATPDEITNTYGNPIGIESGVSKFFTLPDDLWFITYESVNVSSNKCGKAGVLDVLPVTQDEYNKIKRNPFRGATNRRALRLDLADGVIEIVSKYPVSKYYLRYLRKVKPIILTALPDDLSIDSSADQSSYCEYVPACELHEALHRKILDRAVLLALQSRGYSLKNNSGN